MKRLRITEIFFSIQGESTTVGLPTVFIRLTGCPLRCDYCDTAYAFTGGKWMTIDSILEQTNQHQAQYVTVTGGEPLAQPDCLILLKTLCEHGYHVSLETSGALDINQVDKRIMRVMDLKTPGSGEVTRNRYENIAALQPHDQVKFVICDQADYEWAKTIIKEHQLTQHCEVLFSPSHNVLSGRELAEWILTDHLPVRLQLQIHKFLWGDVPGR